MIRARTPRNLLSVAGAIHILVSFSVAGCKDRDRAPEGASPPPVASFAPGACRDGGGTVSDPLSAAAFPRMAGSYCIDPNGPTRAYGVDTKQPLDQVCTEQFNGECEIYKGFGLDRVVTMRYVDGGGSPGEVSVVLARFATKEGAYGFFSRRVVGSDDPRALSTRVLTAGGAGAIGTGEAYVWRGLHVVQLTYANTDEGRGAFAASSERVLPGIATAIGERLPGELAPPRAVALLPAEKRLPNGATYIYDDLLGVRGVGGGAMGYYEDGARRYRLVVVARTDAEAAADVLETFAKLPGAEKDKYLPFPARGFVLKAGDAAPKVRWWVAQVGAQIVGVGDEEQVLDAPGPEREARSLPREAMIARLRQLVSEVAARTKAEREPPPSPSAAGSAGTALPVGSTR
ncbi:MAG: hypothetical protein JW751_13925 [Polyangiaceae bacterium]|nr:hypothetical protein [Polyangiaceae bacterium]